MIAAGLSLKRWHVREVKKILWIYLRLHLHQIWGCNETLHFLLKGPLWYSCNSHQHMWWIFHFRLVRHLKSSVAQLFGCCSSHHSATATPASQGYGSSATHLLLLCFCKEHPASVWSESGLSFSNWNVVETDYFREFTYGSWLSVLQTRQIWRKERRGAVLRENNIKRRHMNLRSGSMLGYSKTCPNICLLTSQRFTGDIFHESLLKSGKSAITTTNQFFSDHMRKLAKNRHGNIALLRPRFVSYIRNIKQVEFISALNCPPMS